tara:strand:+ start:588 stop:953 length:366 start_codon:yes stop_codon:yes gene_type:complete
MHEDLIGQIMEAIDRSKEWAEKGWKVTFGRREVEVSSLHQAQSLPQNVVCREEAVNYWTNVEQTGREAAKYGKKAIAALKRNDLRAAEDAIYFAKYLEKAFADYTRTWKPVHEAVKRELFK